MRTYKFSFPAGYTEAQFTRAQSIAVDGELKGMQKGTVWYQLASDEEVCRVEMVMRDELGIPQVFTELDHNGWPGAR